MALEVIGGIASILQLAGTVYTISKTLYEVGEALSNAPSDIKDLARDLETFSDELHLLSTLLHGKDGRYADQVYRLTAKIIGDCATICTKIDRIIRKLRSGSVLAKIKWLYKEKEIMKLLARLRDLKLSLMGTLSVLSALRADNMMDSLGINNPSMIGGPNRDGLSTETRMQVEDTRLKLAGMSMKDTTGASLGSKSLLASSASLVSGGSSSTLGTSATSSTYVSPPATRIPSTTSFSTSSFISMAVVPKSMPPILNTHANQSVDSFHSALSYQNRESLDGRTKQVESFFKPEDLNDIPVIPQSVVVSDRHDKPSFSVEESHQLNTSESESLKGWRNEMILSAMKHFNMNILDAEEWAKHLPVPSNISATTGPTDQAETSPHPKVENKPQEIEHGKVYHGYQGESSSQYEYYEALERESSCEIPELLNFMPEMGYIPSAIHSPASPEHILVESDSAKSQNHQIDAVLGSSMGKETSFGGFGVDGPRMEESDGYSASPACSPVSPAYSCIEADSSQIQADKTSSSFMGDKKRLDNSKFMDESVTTNNWHLTEEKKMSPSSLKYIPSKSNDLMGHHDYDTDLTKQTSLSSQVASYLDRGNLDASITQTRHTLNQINNADPSKCLPPKRELDPHYISDLRDLTAHDCTDAFNNEEQDGSPLDEHEAWVQRNREERRRRRRSSATVQKRSLAGHEVQLILLKDQNKRRQEIAKLGQQNSCQQLSETSHQANLESALPKLNVPANELAYLDDQSQLVLIKKENEDRLALTRQVQRIQNAMLPSNSVAPNPQPETSRADDILFTGKKSADSPYSKPNLFGIPTQLSPVDPSFAQSEQFVQVNNSSCTTPGVILQTNQKYTAIQTWPSHGTQQQHQKLQSSIQRTQRIQMQQQQQKQMVRLSPHRRLGVTERVAGGDSGRWHNFDACLSMEISANMPSVLHGLGTENLLPKTQPQEVQMLNRASQETYIRDGQPSYPSISPYGKSEPRGRMELPPGYTDDLSGQVFKSSKIDRSNNDSILNFQNEVSNKGPGGFWIRGFINVKSLDAVMWSNLEQYLKWQRVYATSEAGSIPLVANSDWFANLYKERIALRRQMFPRAASCIQKILDVLAVMEETIGLKIGAIAWACLLGAVENLLSYGTNWTVDSQTRIITEMSEIASIIARYTVMENIYSQWKGMSLDKDYEQSLINLSTHVLIYLGAFVPSLSESSTNADMKPYFEKIIEADTACREFTVIVSSNNNDIDRKRLFEEFSDDSDDTVDSDGTILGVDGNEQVNDTPSSAKRTKI